jgi:hypothetical protein
MLNYNKKWKLLKSSKIFIKTIIHICVSCSYSQIKAKTIPFGLKIALNYSLYVMHYIQHNLYLLTCLILNTYVIRHEISKTIDFAMYGWESAYPILSQMLDIILPLENSNGWIRGYTTSISQCRKISINYYEGISRGPQTCKFPQWDWRKSTMQYHLETIRTFSS